MDPKMDSGIVCRYYSVDEAIEDGAAPIPLNANKTLDVHCIIDVMDHLLSCEVLPFLNCYFYHVNWSYSIIILLTDLAGNVA